MKITPSASAISNCSQELLRRMAPGHRTTPRVSKPANSMESAAQAERSWTVLVEDPEDINGSGRGPRIIDRCEAEGVTNTWTYGRSAGAIQIWDGSPSRASTSSGTPPHTESKDSGGG